MLKISVIIPTYNRRDTLVTALKSVAQQSYPAHEIIVIDDGSTDNTCNLLKQQFPTIHVICQSNQGVSHARNRGIEHATGDWLAFLDSDDEWLPHKLETQVQHLVDSPEYKVCHTEEIWIRHGKRVNPMKKHQKSGGWIFRRCLPLCAMSPSSILIHREVFESVGGFDEWLPACEDYDLWLKITARYPVLFIQQPLIIKYGGHADQLSARYWGMDRFRIKALQNIIDSGILKPDDRAAAIAMLIKKCRIYSQGALKRDKTEEAEKYRHIMERYQ